MSKYLKMTLFSILIGIFLFGCSSDTDDTNSSEGTKNSNASKELIVVDWGGTSSDMAKEAIYEPFGEEYGVDVKVVSPPEVGKLKAMVENEKVEWDVVSQIAGIDQSLAAEGLLEELDYSIIDNSSIDPEMVFDHAIGHQMYNYNIAYNTDEFSEDNHPKTWAEFWDTEKFPGPRSLGTEVFGTFEAALLADGVAPEDLYPLDIDRVFESLDKIKDDVKVWWEAGAQPPQLLSTKEVLLSSTWNGRVASAKADGEPVDNEINETSLILYTTWTVPKGAPNKDLAMEFINYALSPEAQARYSELVDYQPTNKEAIDLLSEDRKERLGLTESAGTPVVVDAGYWADNFEEATERFNQWRIK